MAMVARNFTRSRHLIDQIRSGRRTIEACVATPQFHPLRAGDRVNVCVSGGELHLVCEITAKAHYPTIAELIKGVGVERIVGAGKGVKRGARRGRDVGEQGEGEESAILLKGGLSELAMKQHGVFAFHLKVVEDMFADCDEQHELPVLALRDLEHIAHGRKTIDARLVLPYRRAICPGDRLLCRYHDVHSETVWHLPCEASAIVNYASFRDLLETEGIERCFPDCVDLQSAIKACHSQAKYFASRQLEVERGVVAIHLRPLEAVRKLERAAGGEGKKSRL